MPAHPGNRSGKRGALAALIALLLGAAVASAHTTTVTRSEPAAGATVARAPAQVVAQFSEELDTRGSTMIVKNAAGVQVSDGSGRVDLNDANHATMLAALPAALPDGVYTVAWHALLTDGDASDGTFKFTVAAAAPAQAAATAAATAAPAATVTLPAATAQPQAAAQATVTATGRPTTVAPTSLPATGGSGPALAAVLAALLAIVVALALARAAGRGHRS